MSSRRPSFRTASMNSRTFILLISLTVISSVRIAVAGRAYKGGSPRVSPRLSGGGRRCMVGMVIGHLLLERERELGALGEGFTRAGTGDGTLILIEGPAGAGKTELAGEARVA